MYRCIKCIVLSLFRSLFKWMFSSLSQAVEFFASWHDIIYHLTFSTIIFIHVPLYFLRQCARSRSVANNNVVAKNMGQESERVCLYCILWVCLNVFEISFENNNSSFKCHPGISLSDLIQILSRRSRQTLLGWPLFGWNIGQSRLFNMEFKVSCVVFTSVPSCQVIVRYSAVRENIFSTVH